MTDWKEKLKNIEKEETNVTNISSSVNSGGSRIHRISDIKEKRDSINNDNKKESIKMITVEGALSDLGKLIAESQTESAATILKGIKVLIKFVSTMRSNQLLTEDDKKAIKARKVTREVKPE